MFRHWLLAFALCCVSVLPSAAQVPAQSQFRYLGVQDGLPNPLIHAIDQDREGYLWVGTKDGLARFDGGQFKIYRHTPGDDRSLPANSVTVLHVDARNRIWVGVEGFGLYRMDEDHSGFTAVPLLKDESALDIWAIASDAQGAVWFGTFGKGLFRMAPDGAIRHFLPTPGQPGLPDENVLSLAFDPEGTLWVATSSGLVQWRDGRFIAFDNSRLSSPVVLNLMPDPDYGMWIATRGGLNLAGPDGGVQVPEWSGQLSNPSIMAVLADTDGSRIFVARRGLNRLSGGRIEQLYGSNEFVTAFRDRSGGFWFGGEQGLLRQPAAWRHFSAIPAGGKEPGTLRNARIRNYLDLGDGSFLFSGNSDRIDRYWPGDGRLEPFSLPPSPRAPAMIDTLLKDGKGLIWLGGERLGGNGLWRFDPGARALRFWYSDSPADPTLLGPAKHLWQTPDGTLWVAYYGGGLQARDPDSGRILFDITPKSGHGLRFPDIEALFTGPDGQLWLAGGEGVLRWDPKARRLLPVPGAPDERVFSALLTGADTLWLGRLGVLEVYRWRDGALRRAGAVDGADGMPAVEPIGMAAGRDGELWVTSQRGLIRYDLRKRRVRVYGIGDGLPGQEFADRPPYIGADGRAFALSPGAVIQFQPRRLAVAGEPPHLVIEQAAVRRGEDQLLLDHRARIVLEPGDRDFSVDALLLVFDDAATHRFRSRLSGYDPDWVEMGVSGKRSFSRLPAGDYRLELIAAGADGEWSAPTVLDIRVLPPWWMTWWAYAAYAGILVLAVYALVVFNRERLKRRHRLAMEVQERELVLKGSEAKSRFLANLGHEIRTPMTGVLGMTELLLSDPLPEATRGRVQSIKKAGEHLLRLMNDALDLSKIEAGQLELDVQPFDLQVMLQDVQALLAPVAAAKDLRFDLDIAPGVGQAYLGDSGRIRQILFNLGNNAIKFTAAGSVRVTVTSLSPKGLSIAVADTGPGMTEEQCARLFQRFVQADGARTAQRFGGSGLGLAISKELAGLMGGDITVVSAPGSGSTFTVNLPLDESAAAAVTGPEPAPAPSRAVHARTILLVEDDETILSVVGQLLRADGHVVREACNALEALAQSAQERFDAVFCDVDLPGMDGLELTKVWRAQGMRAPVIALTARTQADAEQQCLEAGMDGFLRKPVTGAQLRQALESALS